MPEYHKENHQQKCESLLESPQMTQRGIRSHRVPVKAQAPLASL
jgi:hypothetical protein